MGSTLVHVPFFTLYVSPFPSPFPLRPLTPTRFPIWESSWAHRDSRRGFRRGSRFRSSPCFHTSSRLWFPPSETAFQGPDPLVLRRFEAIQGDSMGGWSRVPITVPMRGLLLLPKRVPAMLPNCSRMLSTRFPALFLGIKNAPEAVSEHGFRSWFSVRFSYEQRENYYAPNREIEVAPWHWLVMGQSHLSSKGQNTLTSACAGSSPIFRPLYSSISLPLPPATPNPHPVPDLGILVGTSQFLSWFPTRFPLPVPSLFLHLFQTVVSSFWNHFAWAGSPDITAFWDCMRLLRGHRRRFQYGFPRWGWYCSLKRFPRCFPNCSRMVSLRFPGFGFGNKRLRKRCLSTVSGAGFLFGFHRSKGKTILPQTGKTSLPLDMVLTTGRNHERLFL